MCFRITSNEFSYFIFDELRKVERFEFGVFLSWKDDVFQVILLAKELFLGSLEVGWLTLHNGHFLDFVIVRILRVQAKQTSLWLHSIIVRMVFVSVHRSQVNIWVGNWLLCCSRIVGLWLSFDFKRSDDHWSIYNAKRELINRINEIGRHFRPSSDQTETPKSVLS